MLFNIGRTKQAGSYEKLSAVILLLGVMSLVEDWVRHAAHFSLRIDPPVPFANMIFVTGILSLLAMGAMLYVMRSGKHPSAISPQKWSHRFLPYFITIIFLATAYFVFFEEIAGYFSVVANHVQGADGSFVLWHNEVSAFRHVIWLLYSMVFAIIAMEAYHPWTNSEGLKVASLMIIGLLSFLFLASGLPALNELSANYFDKQGTGLYFGAWNLFVRYIIMAATIVLVWLGRKVTLSYGEKTTTNKVWQVVIHLVILGMLSAEYLQWTGIGGNDNQYKLGLSTLWGVYALYLIVWGIYKKQRHLRYAGIGLFIITFIKLFLYDLAESDTVTKTVSFISLGAMLLLVSYLYNRYKDVMFGKDEI